MLDYQPIDRHLSMVQDLGKILQRMMVDQKDVHRVVELQLQILLPSPEPSC
jgi:hypothetical protein